MPKFRHILFVLGLLAAAAGPARAVGTVEWPEQEMLVIELEHHWVMELAGQRFGLIQFDTPSTTVLLGGLDFDLPVRASAVVAPLVAVPALIAASAVLQTRRRRFAFEL